MTCSYIEGNVPELIVLDIFRNILRFTCNIKRFIDGDLILWLPVCDANTLPTRPTIEYHKYELEQVWISKQFSRWTSESFVIYHGTSKFRKIRNNSGKTTTHRAENIFPKYLLYYVHEIARKYPREKKRYSSFSDSVHKHWHHPLHVTDSNWSAMVVG
jgi:hypothetical protein